MSTAYLFRKVPNEQVAIARRVQALALNKDPSAARLLQRMRKKFPGAAAPGDKFIRVVNDADMKL